VAAYLRGVVIDEVVNGFQADFQGNWTNYTFHHDNLQSVLGLSGHEGTVLQTISYGPFGTRIWPLSLKDLYKSVRKRCGRAKVLAEILVTIGSDDQGIEVAAKIVFVRDRNSKKWLALLSTDTTLTAEEIIKLYRRRWDIEVFFKMAKSFLNLAKEFQSRSFDALVAHATLVCCRYIMLELAKRENADPRPSAVCFTLSATKCGRLSIQRHWHCYLSYWKKPWATLSDCAKNR